MNYEKIKKTNKNDSIKYMGKIIGINLLLFFGQIFLAYSIASEGGISGLLIFFAYLMSITLPLQFFVNLLLSGIHFYNRDNLKGISFLLSFLIVFLIGYSVCGGYELVLN